MKVLPRIPRCEDSSCQLSSFPVCKWRWDRDKQKTRGDISKWNPIRHISWHKNWSSGIKPDFSKPRRWNHRGTLPVPDSCNLHNCDYKSV